MRKITFAAVGAALVLTASQASAYSIFFGEDLNNSSSVPLASIPNSSGAESTFLSHLVGVGTETFEGQTTGASAPLALTFPGAGTATLTGGNGNVVSQPAGTASFGRYSVPSASSTKFWEVEAGGNGNFAVGFSQSISAFGFFGIDIGDFGGQLTLALSNGDNLTVDNTIGSNGSTDGSVLFFGLIADNSAEQFNSIDFKTTTGQGDVFAFDNFTIGSQEQVKPPASVPEPNSLALLALGLVGYGLTRRKSRRV